MRALLLAAALAAALPVFAASPAPKGAAPATPKNLELNRIVAVVNDDVVTHQELTERLKLVERQLREKKTAMPDAKQLRKQVLDRLVLERLQLEQAKAKGIRVDDETVNQVLASIAKENGLSFDQFRSVIEKDGIDFARFRENIRTEVTIARLRNATIDSKVTISPQEVALFLESAAGATQDVEYRLSHILVGVPEQASPDDVQKARATAERIVVELRGGADFRQLAASYSSDEQGLQGGDLGWRKGAQLPTVFSDLVSKLNVGDVADPVRSASGFHIVKLTDKRSEARAQVVQTRARHILIKTSDKVPEDEARLRAGRLHERLISGADFAELARTNSDDPGSAAKGGELGWSSPGELVPEFQAEMDKLEANGLSTPFKSRFGWHIVQVLERRKQEGGGNQQQRAQAQELLRQRKIEEETQDWLRRLRDEAYVEFRLEG